MHEGPRCRDPERAEPGSPWSCSCWRCLRRDVRSSMRWSRRAASLANAGWNVTEHEHRVGHRAREQRDPSGGRRLPERRHRQRCRRQSLGGGAGRLGQHTRSVQLLESTRERRRQASVVTSQYVYSHASSSPIFGPRPGNLDASPLINLAGLGRDVAIGGVTTLVVIVLLTVLWSGSSVAASAGEQRSRSLREAVVAIRPRLRLPAARLRLPAAGLRLPAARLRLPATGLPPPPPRPTAATRPAPPPGQPPPPPAAATGPARRRTDPAPPQPGPPWSRAREVSR